MEEEEEADGAAADAAAVPSGRAILLLESRQPELLTLEVARAILASAFVDRTWRGLARACKAFRAACFAGEVAYTATQLGLSFGGAAPKTLKSGKAAGGNAKGRAKPTAEDALQASEGKQQRPHFTVASSRVFHLVVTEVLQRAGAALAFHMGTPHGGNFSFAESVLPERVPLEDFPGRAKVAPLAKGIIMCALQLLATSSDAAMLTFVLRSLRLYVPYLQGQGSLTRKVTRALLELFSSHPEGSVRLAAYMRVRQCASALPYPAIDGCLKGAYMAFVRGAKFMTEQTAPHVLLMANCVADLFGVDEAAAYMHAFVYLRQLAIHLRTAITTRSEQSVAAVTSWQFCSSLRLWATVVCRHAQDPARPLFQLVYPLVQTVLGAARLQPGPRHFPLRLQLCAVLVEVGWATGVYIPVAPLLLEVLRSPALAAKPRGGGSEGGAPTPLALLVKASGPLLGSRAFLDALVSRVFELLLDFLRSHFCSVAFPELAAPCVLSLRRFAKETRVGSWRSRARALVDAVSGQALRVAQRRAALNSAPGDRIAITGFMRAEAQALREQRGREREKVEATATAKAGEYGKQEAKEEEADEAAAPPPAPAPMRPAAASFARVSSSSRGVADVLAEVGGLEDDVGDL